MRRPVLVTRALRFGKLFRKGWDLTTVSVPLLVTTGVGVMAGLVDFARFRIPNAITFPFLISGFVYHVATGGLEGLRISGGGCLACFAVVLILYLMGAMGAGDVKFTAGIGAWLGAHTALAVFFVAAMGTALYSVAILIWQGGLAQAMVSTNFVLYQLYRFKVVARHLVGVPSIEAIANAQDRRKRLVPFAAMLAVGILAVVTWKLVFPT